MPSRRPSPEHQEAVSRRLALLSAELAAEGHTRIRHPRRRCTVAGTAAASPPDPPAGAGARPARRPTAGPGAGRRVPATLRGRVALGSAQLAVVAVLVATGLAVTCWWVVRGDADRLEAPAITPVPARGDGAGAAPRRRPVAASAESATGTVTVDVAGKVRRPGIVVLDAGVPGGRRRWRRPVERARGRRPLRPQPGPGAGRRRAGRSSASPAPAGGRGRRGRGAGRARAARWSTSTPPPRSSSRRCPRSGR